MTGQARVFVFSGRADPTWPLDDEQLATLETLWAELHPVKGPGEATLPARLGYRGSEVTAADGRRWVASGGLVTLHLPDGVAETRIDTAARVEAWVVASAPPGRLPPDLPSC